MAKGNWRRGRRARTRGNGTGKHSRAARTSLAGNSLTRSLHVEQLEDRRMLATFTVVNPFDLQDDGNGMLEVVPGSLRAAIESAEEFDDADTIVFSGFQFDNPTSISLQRDMDMFGELAITFPVNIIGPGPGKLSIFAAPGRRIFNVNDGGDDVDIAVSISGLTLSGGSAAGADAEGQGGAIFNTENLSLTNVVISNSTASSGGGGIFHDIGNLRIERSLIQDNTSQLGGGGIQNGATADQSDNFPTTTISNSTITGNAANGGDSGYGGGIFNIAGTVNIEQSTLLGNSANVDGGGVASQGFDPMADEMGMAAETSGNTTTNIHGSIIVGNTAGLMNDPNDVASTGMTDEPAPFDPQIHSNGYNLFGVLTHPIISANMDVTLPPGGPGDMANVEPLTLFIGTPYPMDPFNPELAVPLLADYGGEVPVFMPDPNKVGGLSVIDQGDTNVNNLVGAFDQRGRHFTRTFEAGALINPRIDIGAAEYQDGLFVVDTLEDESDSEYSVGDFSLREALEFSEKNPGHDTIAFSFSLRTEPDPNPFTPAPTIRLTLGELVIAGGVDIQGPTFQLEIDGTSSSRIFNVLSSANPVLISDLTLINGGGVVSGGAISNSGNLTIQDTYFLTNNAINGAALFIQSGDVTVDSSTFAENSAANNGGGIYVDSTAGTVDIINSTISANEAANRGAGITNLGTNTTVEYSTITLNNSASTRGSGITNLGGGLLNVLSTIVAGNLNNDIEFFNGSAAQITSLGYNLVGNGNAAFTQFIQSGDQNGVVDPLLASLAFAGGPTPTHQVLAGSLALDAGDPLAVAGIGGVPEFDQRGDQFTRVFDGDVSGTARIDIGAYELQETTYRVDSPFDENDGNFTPGNFSLREAIEVANSTASPLPEIIVFDMSLDGSTIFLSPAFLAPFTTPDIKITSPVDIFGPGITINGSGLPGTSMFTVDDGDDGTMIGVSFEDFNFQGGSGRVAVNREDLDFTSILATGNNGVFSNTLGDLTINTSVLSGNSSFGSGGAVVSTDGNLTIVGTGYDYSVLAGNTTNFSGGNGGGISFSDNTTDGRTLSLSRVIISGNNAPAGAADGGGLFISGNGSVTPGNMTQATVVDSVVSGNSTTGSNSEGAGIFIRDADVTLTGTVVSLNKSFGTNSKGAGIYLSGGSLTIGNSPDNNSLVTQNSTYGNYAPGAGIANLGGNVTLNQATISRNTTSGIDSHGGGIYSTGGSLTLNETTVNDNSTAATGTKGGGIFTDTNLTGSQTASIFNSTVSGNTATLRGGGIYNADGLLKITYSTITDNSVPFFGNGGGVASFGNSSTTRTEVRSSIIAGNFSTADPVNPNSDVESVAGSTTNSFTSLGYNLIGKGLPLALGEFDKTGDQANIVDPRLGSLSLINGGPTATHALLPDSPAINAGDPGAVAGVGNVPTYDQRGTGFTRVQQGRIDIGAFESDLLPLAVFDPADFNEDGEVSGFDFLAWQRGLGTPAATKADGDADGNMIVDAVDLGIWQASYGTSSPLVAALSSGTSSSSESPQLASALTASAESTTSSPTTSTPVESSFFIASLSLNVGNASLVTANEQPLQVAAVDESLAEYGEPTSGNVGAADTLDFGELAALRQTAESDSSAENESLAEDAVFAMLGSGGL